ncbi:MAG: ArnT family glycosyltransferase [Candidatus Eiseniibacteriota bacterium]
MSRRAVVPLLLLLIAAGVVFAKLGRVHLANFDDCYYAEKAKEMVRDGDWVTPHFAGVPRTDNPPLFIWLMALAFLACGVREGPAIFWSALSGALCVPVLYLLARRLRAAPFEAWVAAVVLLGTQYFLKYSRHAMFDVFLTLLFLLGILGYARAAQGERKWFLLLGAATGLGILTKSVLGLFPLAVAVLHMLATGRAGLLRSRWFLAALAVAAGLAVPWYAAQMHLHRELFLDEHVRWLLIRRGLGAGRPWWSCFDYLLELGRIYWPWLPLAAAGAWLTLRRAVKAADATPAAWSPRDTARLLVVWFGVVLIPLSLAAEKKLWYVMSIFPCLALLAAIAAEAGIRSETTRRAIVGYGFALLATIAVAAWALPLPLGKARRPELQEVALAAREAVPRDQVIANLDLPYWPVVNQFLFYSDHAITEPLGNPVAVREKLQAGMFALLTPEGLARVAAGDSGAYEIAASAGDWRLVRAATTTTR